MTGADRLKAAVAALVRELVGDVRFYGIYEYRVAACSGGNVDGTPADRTLGLPDVAGVPMRPSILGETSTLPSGSSCLVGFVNGSRSRPYIAGGDPASIPTTLTVDATGTVKLGPTATAVQVAGGGQPIARLGDAIVAGPFAGTITAGSAKGTCG